MQLVKMYLDHPKVGCGFRNYLVLKQGRTIAHLLCVDTAQPLKVSVRELDHAEPQPFKPTRLAKRLRATAKTYGRADSNAVKDAVRALRA